MVCPPDYPAVSVLVLHDRAGLLRLPALQRGLRRQTQSEWFLQLSGFIQFKTEKHQVCSGSLISLTPECDGLWTLDRCYTCVCQRTLLSFKQLITAGQICVPPTVITQISPQRGFSLTHARVVTGRDLSRSCECSSVPRTSRSRLFTT